MNYTPEEIIANNTILVIKAIKINLPKITEYYLALDIKKSILWSKEKNQYYSNWQCLDTLIDLPCDKSFEVLQKRIPFEDIINKSIAYYINKYPNHPPSL